MASRNYTILIEDLLLREDESSYSSRNDDSSTEPHKKYKLIDLFCGAGGMTLGFTSSLSD